MIANATRTHKNDWLIEFGTLRLAFIIATHLLNVLISHSLIMRHSHSLTQIKLVIIIILPCRPLSTLLLRGQHDSNL